MNKRDRDLYFCTRPGNCPLRKVCERNEHTWKVKPVIRVYHNYTWDEENGCEGFIKEPQSRGKHAT